MEEIWKDIPGYEGLYEASDQGRVKSLDRVVYSSNGYFSSIKGVILKPYSSDKFYKQVWLYKNGKRKIFCVHKLILLTFKGPTSHKIITRHLDSNKHNNCLSNLCYGTYSENEADKIRAGTDLRGIKAPCNKLKEEDVFLIRKYKKEGGKTGKIAKYFNVSPSAICDIQANRTWAWLLEK